ncbi:MAG: peptidase M64 [Muribaculaceae bacterium]|nr:peptidase M64 [Muribaculaceae bacterium]
MKKPIILLLLAALTVITASAQSFDDCFNDSTLRLDYVFAGNHDTQQIYFEKACVTPLWAGRKGRLTEAPLKGNGQLMVKDHATGQPIYVHTFSTLFQEWLATEEATQVNRAFETSYNVPLPKCPVDITVTLTDFHGKVVTSMTHMVDPADILIRRLGPNGVPFHYVWKGQTLPVKEKPVDSQDNRNFTPSEGVIGGEPNVTDCIDLAIVAEGYTHAQMGKFYNDCQRAVDALFAREPFKSLKHRFNVVAVAAESLDGGPSVPHLGRWRNTAVSTNYDTFYSDRYLTTRDIHHLYDLLSCVPFEHIIVLVNSDTYGGGGIYNQLMVTTSDHPTFAQVLVHEFGHSYGGLGDEYFYDDAYETMYPADTEPWEPNLTTLVDFNSKWADMLPKGTAIPTPQDPKVPNYRKITNDKERRLLNAATQRVGVFEGGGYQSKGVYRPAQECRMKINEVEDFCPVCIRAIQRITVFYTAQ